ncbi:MULTISPECIES: NAD(P)/FAD-dependent oxidoreductase [unclassified Cyanobium]|uniref:NAD(P)/FAD-dependent oxidoreductase n=1 Tax=unclassified Cyanobium TaxID=2627006 RepID=UPI0020CB9831|nr:MULTISPECIES: NAD(P)/FAD-dependent oxidoreductase [unclassified Cyanobium]MCP9835662.1 NAD(P)/FAD-dependent oxidoreductase [Cyanobium sp. La Preciosa 7G6]MCP9938428.1 NAD(P)/FAD-dependent oxidoreductase [Cyanobium sp. Aljojuca 7A6]
MLPSRASVVVVGGGPAGFMAAIAAAEAAGGRFPGGVLLLESTPEPLHKVLISGGGRCNVTHACWDPRVLVDHYPRGGKALRGPFSRFATADTVAWFQAHGLQLVEEADGRLFPRSNRSSSVVDTLRQAAIAAGVVLHTTQAGQTAQALPGGGFRLRLRSGAEVVAEHLVLATGSHPSGHRIAASLGHGLVAPVPSLFTLTLADHPLVDLAGVAMDPVQLELLLTPLPGPATNATKPLRQRGPVLITHWGLSGPATLRLTAFAARVLRERRYRAELRVDWTGGRKPAELEGWFAAARRDQARRQLGNWRPWPDLSRRLWLHLLAQGGVEPTLRWADLPRRSEQALITALRDSRYRISGRGPFGEEFVTAGGIPLAEVNLASMQSRLQPGLFLVGELLDVDGVTGGFNFQHCWSSGWLAGQALAAQRTCS